MSLVKTVILFFDVHTGKILKCAHYMAVRCPVSSVVCIWPMLSIFNLLSVINNMMSDILMPPNVFFPK